MRPNVRAYVRAHSPNLARAIARYNCWKGPQNATEWRPAIKLSKSRGTGAGRGPKMRPNDGPQFSRGTRDLYAEELAAGEGGARGDPRCGVGSSCKFIICRRLYQIKR